MNRLRKESKKRKIPTRRELPSSKRKQSDVESGQLYSQSSEPFSKKLHVTVDEAASKLPAEEHLGNVVTNAATSTSMSYQLRNKSKKRKIPTRRELPSSKRIQSDVESGQLSSQSSEPLSKKLHVTVDEAASKLPAEEHLGNVVTNAATSTSMFHQTPGVVMEEALGVKEESISSLDASLDSHNGSRGSWDTERNLPQSNTHSSLTPFTDGIKQEDIKFEVEVTQEFIAEEEADTVAQDPVVKEEKELEFFDVDKVRIEDEHVAPEVDGLSCVTPPVTSSSSQPDHPSSRKATKTKSKNRDIEDRKKLKDLSFSQNVVNEEFTQPTEQCQDFVSPSTSGIEYDKKKCSGKKKKVEHLEEQTALKKAIDVLNKPQDDYSVFGDNVASELRQLRSDENRKILKRTIMKAIIEMGEKEDLEYSSTSTSTPILPCSSPESHNSNYDTNVGHGTTT